MPKIAFDVEPLYGTPTNSLGEWGAKNGPKTAIATSPSSRKRPIWVRRMPSAVRRSATIGRALRGGAGIEIGSAAVAGALIGAMSADAGTTRIVAMSASRLSTT